MTIIELSYEQEEDIVRSNLVESLSDLHEEITSYLREDGVLSAVGRENLHDAYTHLIAMQDTAKYYTPPQDWDSIAKFDVNVDAIRAALADVTVDVNFDDLATDLRIDESSL